MTETVRETERKYEAETDESGALPPLPELRKLPGVAGEADTGVQELDATYYDTEDLRLAAARITLRRRTGGEDAGWHLKLPVSRDVREEVRLPPGDALPAALAALVRARTRGAALLPVVRLRSRRTVRTLYDAKGATLAELSADEVEAERLTGPTKGRRAAWAEAELELGAGADPKLFGPAGKRFAKAGYRRSSAPSKLARALEETGAGPAHPVGPDVGEATAGAEVLAYLRAQYEELLARDVAVRRELPGAVHKMRVALRRTRSALRSYRPVLDAAVTGPLRAELKWLAGELGADRDREVLAGRLQARVAETDTALLLGPVEARLRQWAVAEEQESRARVRAALDSERHLRLLDALDALFAAPPLREKAARPAPKVLPKAVAKEHHRLVGRMERALELPPGPVRDRALHEARKKAKRLRYAAEAAKPSCGKPAKRLAKDVKALQSLLGDHHDSAVARATLRELGIRAHTAGETAFTWGLLHGREEARALDHERELPGVWAGLADRDARAELS
ncbi:CYTH and CHAD domain-containing protein [Streptomyces sp. NPDC049954]|uniref:CYTH and CHAD domain-containing protein n=1 Tax=Streptomyces sp. NPDC049954 TaxID=3155779 RepID=UPI003429C9CA